MNDRLDGPPVMRLALAPLCVTFLLFIMSVATLVVPRALLIAAIAVAAFTKTTIAVTLLITAGLVYAFWRRHRVSGVTMLLGILTVVLLASAPTPARSPSRKAADLLCVAGYRAALQRQAEDLRRQGIAPIVAVIAIDGFGSITYGVAFDPTGEILLPVDNRSQSWMAATGRTDLSIDNLQAWHVAGDYYAWFHY